MTLSPSRSEPDTLFFPTVKKKQTTMKTSMNSIKKTTFSLLASAFFASSLWAQEAATASTPAPAPKKESIKVSQEEAKANLFQAYQKEFVFLENEKRALQKRLDEIAKEKSFKVTKAENEVNALETLLLQTREKAEQKTTDMREVEKQLEAVDSTLDMIDATVSQAMVTLEKYNVKSYDKPKDMSVGDAAIAEVKYIFDNSKNKMKDLDQFVKTKGSFYLMDGTEVEGDIVKVGEIASYGLTADGKGGALAPAGGGRLRIWDEGYGLEAAKALVKGQQPETLPIFVYENVNKKVDAQTEKTIAQIIESGGIIAYIIVGMGGLGLFLILLRAMFLSTAASDTTKLVTRVAPMVREGKTQEALEICKKQRGAASRVLASTIMHLKADPAHLEDVISESILHESPYLERFESAITVFAAVAPLLGLLGTVTGMISTFDVLTVYGAGDPKLLSGGISEALVTTELGLAVAIPMLLLGSILSGWGERIMTDMEKVALRIMNISKKHEAPQEA